MNDDSTSRILAELTVWIDGAPAGARLPSTRELVARHQVSPLTVQKALRTLTTRGLVETRPGVGTFSRRIDAPRPRDHGWQTAALRRPRSAIPAVAAALRSGPVDGLALHSGYPDVSLLPERLVRAAMVRASRSAAAFGRAHVAGHPDLRAWFAAELGGVGSPTATDVIVTPGSQSALASIFRSVVPPGQPLLVESPTYWGALTSAALAGVEAVPVPSGPHGPDPDDLARAFDETGARAFYAQPSFANPTGVQWSPDLAEAVLDVVRAHGAFLVEDDWAHDFGIESRPEPLARRDEAGHVVYVRSLTKSLSPAVRVAAVVARGPVRERILADSGAESMYVSPLLQAAALDVVSQPGWTTHLRGLGQKLKVRRDVLVENLRVHAPDLHLEVVPRGGLHLWARLPDDVDADRLVAGCEAEGVMLTGGHESYPTEAPAPHVRLNYAGPDPSAYPRATEVIGSVLAAL